MYRIQEFNNHTSENYREWPNMIAGRDEAMQMAEAACWALANPNVSFKVFDCIPGQEYREELAEEFFYSEFEDCVEKASDMNAPIYLNRDMARSLFNIYTRNDAIVVEVDELNRVVLKSVANGKIICRIVGHN